MDAVYFDELHKRRLDGKNVFWKTVLLLGCMILCPFLLILTGQLGFFLAAGAIYGTYFLFQRLNQEFEYIYTDGELDIDVIYGKQSRKRMVSVKPWQIEAVCKAAYHLDEYRKRYPTQTVMDFSDGNRQTAYLMTVGDSSIKKLILFSPSDRLLAAWKPCLKERLLDEKPM